jgi:hypothetical protein
MIEDPTMPFCSDRAFQIWDYNVSHGQLLLRSPKSPDIAMNVDVVLWGVEYVEIASMLQGLEIVSPSSDEVRRVGEALASKADPSGVHCFVSGGRRYLVAAAGFKVLRNDLDLFESSLEYFAGTNPARNLGEVLAHSQTGRRVDPPLE